MKKIVLSVSVGMMALAALAFTGKEAPTRRVINQYRFNGTDLSQVTNPQNWSQSTAQVPSCTEGDLPCFVLTDMSISNWLAARSAEEIVEDANARKN